MLDIRGPFRIFITLLLVVALPLCCCSFRGAAAVPGCGAAGAPAAEQAGPACCGHEDGGSAEGGMAPGGERRVPAEPGGCSCDKGKLAGSAAARPDGPAAHITIELTAAMATFAVNELVERGPAQRLGAVCAVLPARSLLRLHCALMI